MSTKKIETAEQREERLLKYKQYREANKPVKFKKVKVPKRVKKDIEITPEIAKVKEILANQPVINKIVLSNQNIRVRERTTVQCDLNGKFIEVYHSAANAAKKVDAQPMAITYVCNGIDNKGNKRYTCKGFRWYYVDKLPKLFYELNSKEVIDRLKKYQIVKYNTK